MKSKTSKYRGVFFHKRNQKWQAQIQHHGKKYHLGYYSKQKDAAEAYDDAAVDLLGDCAKLNFP